MTKLVLDDIGAGYSRAVINENFQKISQEFQDNTLYRANPPGEPNQMSNTLDMNSKHILNSPAPTEPTHLVRLQELEQLVLDSGDSGVIPLIQGRQLGDATTTLFNAPNDKMVSPVTMFVNIDGVSQRPYTDFDVVGIGSIKFSYAPPLNSEIDVTYFEPRVVESNDVSNRTVITTNSTEARTLADRFGDRINVKDFGAVGNGSTNDSLAIQAAIDYVNTLPATQRPTIMFPTGRYLIEQTLIIYSDMSFSGDPRDIGYSFAFNHSSELIASGSLHSMIDASAASSIYIGNLGFYGNNSTDYAIYTAGVFGRASSQTFENLAITLCKKTGIYMANIGITKMSRLQISNCVECAIDLEGWGDADLSGLFINTINFDSTSTVNAPSSATVEGVGIRIRGNPLTNAQSGNINIRGGKIEFTRIGILLNAAQGVNITGINFDNCRKAGVYIESDDITAAPNITLPNTLTCTSIQVVGNRFLGGLANTQTPSSHIFAARARYVTISGNGFKRANDGAIDFFGDGFGQGPDYGVYLFNAEQCTVVGNDLYGAATQNCIRVEHAVPTDAQHTIFSNNLDGTELINPNTVKSQPSYGHIIFAAEKTPIAKNTAKAWVRFNGSGPNPVITDSFNVASVVGAGGTYTITGTINWGVNAMISPSARNWFGASDNANYGAVTANTVIVYSTTSGVLSSNGDISVMIYGA